MSILCAVLLAALLATPSWAQSPSLQVGSLHHCIGSDDKQSCRRTAIDQLDLSEPVVRVRRIVIVSPATATSQLPLAVTLVGTMSADVRWNGVLIGRNGVVGPDAAGEAPGTFRATILVPHKLVRLGPNVVDIRMSAHHRWLPVRTPIQQIGVGPYDGRSSGELGGYWPALLTAGALMLAALYFGAAVSIGRDRPAALILAGVAACATLQLAIEASRSFFDYPYPWHIARIALIVLLAALTSALVSAYAARRYAPRITKRVVMASVATSTAAAVLLPSFDARAWACLFAASILCLFCAAKARHRRDGRVGMIVAGLFASMLLLWRADALDRGYYLFIAALLAGLVAEQVLGLRHLYAGLASERERNEALALRLAAAADETGASILTFRDGAAVYRFREREVVRITAADDYCELTLLHRQPLLVGGTLKALASSLPERFLRVHKSHIVNLAHVATMNPKEGGGHQLLLADGSSTPVGRTYRDAVLSRLGSP